MLREIFLYKLKRYSKQERNYPSSAYLTYVPSTALIIMKKKGFVKNYLREENMELKGETTDKDRILQCQKYYIFKIRDIVNNSFHTLEEKRMECLIQYLDLCINTYEEYRIALDPSKLKRSYEGLIEGLGYQLQNHPFRKLNYYKSDFLHVHRLIVLKEEQRDKELHNIHRNIVTLRKKIASSDIIGNYIQCLKQEDSFGGIDRLMETLISDLLHKGYSLAYLFDWFKKQQEEFVEGGQDISVIDKLRELDRKNVGHTIYIKFMINSDTQLQRAIQLLEKYFLIKKKDEFDYSNSWKDEREFFMAYKEYQALDVKKAVQIALKEFNAVKELFDMWQGTIGCIRDSNIYGWIENETFNTINVSKSDNTKVLGYVDAYYKKQMERFLLLKDNSENEDIDTLERILYTLNTAKSYKVQNRFLNFWSALEYTLYPFPRFTIIEKARVVVPEVFSLFYIKNKMNIFWSRLSYYLQSRMDVEELAEAILFYKECKEEDEDGYNTRNVISVLQDVEKVERITKCFSKHVVIYREWAELHMLINEPKKAAKEIEKYFEGIMHDLNYVYRLRNQLIHSTNGADDSLEYISMRLYRYVNSVLSTILYYKEKNKEFTITDILSSIDATYQDYMEQWKEEKTKRKSKEEEKEELALEDAYKMVRPPYLFME